MPKRFTQSINLPEQSAPSTPASGQLALYAKTDGRLYYKDDAGNELAVLAMEVAAFSKGGTLAVATGTFRWYAPRALTIVSVRASVGTAPTGASLIVDVNKNGSTIFSTQSNRPTIAASGFTDLADAINTTALASGDYLTVDIDQVGSTVAGSDLTVQIELRS